jgi:hypothetical protein
MFLKTIISFVLSVFIIFPACLFAQKKEKKVDIQKVILPKTPIKTGVDHKKEATIILEDNCNQKKNPFLKEKDNLDHKESLQNQVEKDLNKSSAENNKKNLIYMDPQSRNVVQMNQHLSNNLGSKS